MAKVTERLYDPSTLFDTQAMVFAEKKDEIRETAEEIGHTNARIYASVKK